MGSNDYRVGEKIKNWHPLERPREKLLQYGPERLSNQELLTIILRSGRKHYPVVKLAEQILKTFPEEKLLETPIEELRKVPGLGSVQALELVAVFELAKRLLGKKQNKIYLSPKDIYNELIDFRQRKKEYFVAFYLDTRNQEIRREVISVGTLNASLVHPREVFEPAIRYLSAQIILAHNHPSGDPQPSEDDIAITERLKKAGQIIGIEIIDHIIVTSQTYYSFKEHQLI